MDPTQAPQQDPSQQPDEQEDEMSLDDAVKVLEEYAELQQNPKLLKKAAAALAASQGGAPAMSNGAPAPQSIADLRAMAQQQNGGG